MGRGEDGTWGEGQGEGKPARQGRKKPWETGLLIRLIRKDLNTHVDGGGENLNSKGLSRSHDFDKKHLGGEKA